MGRWRTASTTSPRRDFTQRIRMAAVFNGGQELHPLGVDPARPPFVTREVINGELIWHYGPFKVSMRLWTGSG